MGVRAMAQTKILTTAGLKCAVSKVRDVATVYIKVWAQVSVLKSIETEFQAFTYSGKTLT